MDPQPDDGRRWATVAHATVPITGFAVPLLLWWRHRDGGRYAVDQLAEALNWSIVITVLGLASAALIVVALGAVLVPLVWFVAAVFAVLGARAAHRGESFRYPVTWRVVG